MSTGMATPDADVVLGSKIDLMSDAEIRTMLSGIVKDLPTRAPIFLPTDKIPLKEQLKGLMCVRNIYRTGLDSVYRPRLRAVKKQLQDRKRCFVIGNGPSLNHTDLAQLKGEVTFAVNGFFLKAPELDWLPTFYVVEDHLVAEDRQASISAFKGPIKLFPAYLGYCFEESADTIFFNHRPRKRYPHAFDFSTDAEEVTYAGCTVTFTCLQLASYLGFKEIYLIGVDSDYTVPKDAENKEDYSVGILDMKSDDPNHFHPDYFGKGFRWHDPQVDKMLAAYAEARRVLESTGQSIFNATEGGKLEIFERVAYSNLFPVTRSPEEVECIGAKSPLAPSRENPSQLSGTPKADDNGHARVLPAELRKTKTDEQRESDDREVLSRLPRLLLFDITKRGDGTATGDLKATLFADWPEDRFLHFHSLGRDLIGLDRVPPKLLPGRKELGVEDISRLVDEFAPDVILYRPVPDNLALHETAMTVIRASGLPLAIWIMDDWPSRLAADDPELFVRLESDLRELLARADLRLSICDAMSIAFAERYSVPFKAFANAIDPQAWPVRPLRNTGNSTFVLRYAGALAKNMVLDSVRRTARAVERLAGDGVDIRFEISTRANWQKIAEPEFIDLKRTSFRAECPPAAYRELLSQADAVLIAYNFDERSMNYVRYSLANKLPECLASGAPLIAHGPTGIATIDYIRSLDCAVVVTDEDEEALATALKELTEDADRRRDLSERARAVAFSAHNVHSIRRALRAEFLTIAARKQRPDVKAEFQEYERVAHAHVDETQVISVLLGVSARRERTMIDVGSHFGSSARHFVDKWWRIHCFEPDPANRAQLIAKLGKKTNVTIDSRAVGEKAETSKPFFSSTESTGISSLHAFRDTHRQTACVDVTTVADIVAQHGVERVDFLKVDAEGADLQVLLGVPWDRLRPAVIECEFEDVRTLPLGYSYEQLADFLVQKGYVVYVSEWHPIIRYGVGHDWRRLAKYPQPLRTSQAWGNLLAFLADPGIDAITDAFNAHVKFRKPEAAASAAPKGSSDVEHRVPALEPKAALLVTDCGYSQTVLNIRELSNTTLPRDATVLVISKGDDRLLNLDGRQGWHFPRAEDGLYAGHDPADSAAAITCLEGLRAKGADFLLVPDTAYWWFDHYPEFKRYLDSHYYRVRTPKHCVIYRLSAASADGHPQNESSGAGESPAATAFSPPPKDKIAALDPAVELSPAANGFKALAESLLRYRKIREGVAGAILHLADSAPRTLAAADYRRLVHSIRDFVNGSLPRAATLAVVSRGDDELLQMGDRRVWHFPRAANGAYAGHYPVNGPAAIEHLEGLRSMGVEFLLLPRTAFWWLKYYVEFGKHLFANYRAMVSQDKSSLVFVLAGGGVEPAEQLAARRAIKDWDADQVLPSETELQVEIGRLLTRFGRQAEAEALLNEGIRQDPDNPRLYAELIRSARRRGDFEVVERYASAVASRDRIDYVLGIELVHLDVQRDRFDAAKSRLMQLSTTFSSEPALYDLANSVSDRGEAHRTSDQATMVRFLATLAAPAAAVGIPPETQIQIAQILQSLEAHPQALSALRGALRKLDFESTALREFTLTLLRPAGFAASEQMAGGDLQALAAILMHAGNAFRATRDVFRAEACYRLALAAQPQRPATRVSLAFLELERRDVLAAVEHFSGLVQAYSEEASQIIWPAHGELPWPYRSFELAGAFEELKAGAAKWPAISVVIACFDHNEHVEQALLSVLNQDYPALQCVVVAGTTSGKAQQVLGRYSEQLSIVRAEPGTGETDALSRGLSHSTGEILLWLAPDDLLAPGALFMTALNYLHAGADIIAGFCLEHAAGRFEAVHVPRVSQTTFDVDTLGDIFNFWLKDHYFSPPQVAFSRAIFERAGACLDTSLQFTASYDLWLRCAAAGARLAVLQWPVGFRRNENTKAGKSDRHIIECARVRDRSVTAPESLGKRLQINGKLRQALSRKPTAAAIIAPRGSPAFSPDMPRELAHTFEPERFNVTLARALDELQLADFDIVILLVPMEGFDQFREISEAGFQGPIVGWLWDNHLNVSQHRRATFHLDICVPAQGFAAGYLRSPDAVLWDSLPPCSTQWSQMEARLFFDRYGLTNRKDGLLATFGRLPFAERRNQFIQQLINAGIEEVRFIDTTQLDAHGRRPTEERFAEWASYKASLCLPVAGELSQHLFDALLTGQVPIVPADVPDLESLIPEPIQRNLPIVKLSGYTPQAVREAHALAAQFFDHGGEGAARRRHRFALEGHMFVSRMRELLASLNSQHISSTNKIGVTKG